jgi:hypothetical protein
VTSVEAHAYPLLVRHQLNDAGQLLELAADDVALSGHILERDRHVLRARVRLVETGGDVFHRLLRSTFANSRSRVEGVERDTELVAALQIVDEEFHSFRTLLSIRVAEVHQVRAVRKNLITGETTA